MQKIKNYLLFGFTGVCLSIGYSSLFATEIPVRNLQNSPKNLLVQETTQSVNDYIKNNHHESYQFLEKQLEAAIEDAKNPKPDEVVNNLWELAPSNSQLKTRQINGKTEFLMVTWKSTKKPNEDWPLGKKSLTRRVWLTAFPETKEFCHKCQGIGMKVPGEIMLGLRLQQYLGLILASNPNPTYFVEMWVKAEDLSRPCINPEINSKTCKVLPVPVPESNSVLFNIYKSSYASGKPYYPWTGLGYTYDWGNTKKPHVGASEFIIEANQDKPIEVEIVAVTPTVQYCDNQYLK